MYPGCLLGAPRTQAVCKFHIRKLKFPALKRKVPVTKKRRLIINATPPETSHQAERYAQNTNDSTEHHREG